MMICHLYALSQLGRIHPSGKYIILAIGPRFYACEISYKPNVSITKTRLYSQGDMLYIRREKKYLWFRFHIVKKLGSVVGNKFFLEYFFHCFGSLLLGDLQ